MSDLVIAAIVTGGFGVIIEILRRLWNQNKKDHGHVIGKIDEMATSHKEVRTKVYDIAADVRDVKADVRVLRKDHNDLKDRFEEEVG